MQEKENAPGRERECEKREIAYQIMQLLEKHNATIEVAKVITKIVFKEDDDEEEMSESTLDFHI